MIPKTAKAVDLVVKRLREIGQESPDLQEAVLVYEAILPLLRDADLHVAQICMTPEEARRKMEEGRPLLYGLELEIELQEVRALMFQLARSLERSIRTSNACHIRMALEQDRLDVGRLLLRITACESDGVESAEQSLGLDPGLLRTLAESALKPAFRAWRQQLTLMAEGTPWNRGTCYVCGARPTFGELRENNLVRHLRCGRCGADWQFRRLQCLYCGNEDHRTLGFLYTEGRLEKNRVEVCEKCRGYLKVITTFSPTLPELLPVEDLSTLHLDYVAQGHGYIRAEVQWSA
jgi:FdhE protein